MLRFEGVPGAQPFGGYGEYLGETAGRPLYPQDFIEGGPLGPWPPYSADEFQQFAPFVRQPSRSQRSERSMSDRADRPEEEYSRSLCRRSLRPSQRSRDQTASQRGIDRSGSERRESQRKTTSSPSLPALSELSVQPRRSLTELEKAKLLLELRPSFVLHFMFCVTCSILQSLPCIEGS